jgi:hypothetical protein
MFQKYEIRSFRRLTTLFAHGNVLSVPALRERS